MRLTLTLLILFVSFFAFQNTSMAQDWPQFRGPDGNGVLEKLEHPQEWSEEKNMAWSVDTPGSGLSSPIVSGDKIFITSAGGAAPPVNFAGGVRNMRPQRPEGSLNFQVTCLSLKDGSKLWEKTIIEKRPEYPIHGSNSFATATPATDGELVFAYFASAGVIAALDMDGNEVWRKEVGSYPTGNGFGPGSSLTFGQGNVFLQSDNDEKSFVVAFDAASGEEKWRKERSGRTSWSTPLLWKNENRTELITCGSGYVTSYDPATGDQLWTMSGISSAFSASPAADADRIYFGNSGPRSSGPLLAVSSSMSGEQAFVPDTELENLAWSKMQAGPGMSSPVSVNGLLYIPSRGILTCYDAEKGEQVFKNRLELGSTAASMWACGDRVFLLDEDGKTLVIETGPEMKILATNEIDDVFWSTPSVAGNSLLLRGNKKIYCVRE